ncbi:hypothetical protein BBK36DRAFT_17661 [Trichoderma citrinoviride]|uniref:Uncharacterized protein n=1 Tax=Trichoderma citrinoviride TaxID=58853 RepID=A0A2T4BH20_9HYPO|nr:hypothetical protein BBK36DRAFT_17661 [Trichoderma citrinoviride]PTB68624.1 hypothetical protein BBK36DRAFT_17661 [Trichoderma citrinoviride]
MRRACVSLSVVHAPTSGAQLYSLAVGFLLQVNADPYSPRPQGPARGNRLSATDLVMQPALNKSVLMSTSSRPTGVRWAWMLRDAASLHKCSPYRHMCRRRFRHRMGMDSPSRASQPQRCTGQPEASMDGP